MLWGDWGVYLGELMRGWEEEMFTNPSLIWSSNPENKLKAFICVIILIFNFFILSVH